jgi:hypothetical protein
MDRTFWLSLVAVGLAMALVLGSRAIMDAATYANGAALAAEIERLDGAPSSQELADRVTAAAGCIYGFRPRVHTCWYVWAHPERPAYLAVIAQRVQDDAGGSALGYGVASLPFWLLALLGAWRASKRPQVFRPSLLQPRVEPPRPHGRMMP